MAAAAPITLTIAVTIEFVLGIALNLHIILYYIENLKNGVPLGPSNRVHLTKALVNVFFNLMITIQCIIGVFWPFCFFRNEVYVWNTTINMFLMVYNYWLTAVLCGYYCLNITTCAHHIFIWLKRSLSSYLLHILLVIGLGSLAISIPVFWLCKIELPRNTTYQSIALQWTVVLDVTYKATNTILGFFLPLAIVLVFTTFTSWSLIKHIWRMRQNNQGFTWSKLQAQINATRTMILFILLSVFYNVIQVFLIASISSGSNVIMVLICLMMLSYPLSEAIIIIQSSLKLWRALLEKLSGGNRRNSGKDLKSSGDTSIMKGVDRSSVQLN